MLTGDSGRRRRHLEDSVLDDVLLLLMATLAVVAGLRRLRPPMILAFLIVGMIVGPDVLGWVAPTETTETIAEFGIVFLLFALGLSLPVAILLVKAAIVTLVTRPFAGQWFKALREGDVVVLFRTPEAQEHAEAVLLAG